MESSRIQFLSKQMEVLKILQRFSQRCANSSWQRALPRKLFCLDYLQVCRCNMNFVVQHTITSVHKVLKFVFYRISSFSSTQPCYVTFGVGHTHEDIDGIFARIWTKLQNQHCLSPAAYRRIIMEAINTERRVEKESKVYDVFAIPNYCKWFARALGTLFITSLISKCNFILVLQTKSLACMPKSHIRSTSFHLNSLSMGCG